MDATERHKSEERKRELINRQYGKQKSHLVASVMLGAGLELPTELKAHANTAESMDMAEMADAARRIEDQPSDDLYLYASGGMGATLATEVTDDVYNMVIRQAFEAPLTSLLSITTPGESRTLTKDVRPIVEQTPTPTAHARGGQADSPDVKITRVESITVGVYTQYLWIDEMDDVLAAAPAIAASVGRSIASLDADLIIGAILAGVMADDEAVCNATAGNLVTGKPLTVQNVGDGYSAMRKQLADSEAILNENVVPNVLLTGSDNYFPALTELEKLSQQPLRVVEDPRLETGVRNHDVDNATIAGAAAGSWWLLDNRRAIERTVLRGSNGPTVTQVRRNGEDGQWGVGWAIRHAVAVTPLDRTCIRQFEAA